VIDTVGNCAAIESKPIENAGMKVIGEKGGYESADAAKKALNDMKECKGASVSFAPARGPNTLSVGAVVARSVAFLTIQNLEDWRLAGAPSPVLSENSIRPRFAP
jgi:hypothetical protein